MKMIVTGGGGVMSGLAIDGTSVHHSDWTEEITGVDCTFEVCYHDRFWGRSKKNNVRRLPYAEHRPGFPVKFSHSPPLMSEFSLDACAHSCVFDYRPSSSNSPCRHPGRHGLKLWPIRSPGSFVIQGINDRLWKPSSLMTLARNFDASPSSACVVFGRSRWSAFFSHRVSARWSR